MSENKDGLIEVKGLTKFCNRSLTVVDHISFRVKNGRIFGFLGPNAAGKTATISVFHGDT